MKRIAALMLAASLLTGPAGAQGAAEGYSKMSVKAGLMTGNLNTRRPEQFSGGVEIELISDDGSKPNLPISADTINFTWKEGSTTPATINMIGNVHISHPDGEISSQRADWNLETGDVVFTGNPVMDSPDMKGLKADEIRINMETGAYALKQGEVKGYSLQGSGGSGGSGGAAALPGELAEADITDFAALINTIKAQSTQSGDNPGKQILSRLDPQVRGLVESQETAVLVGAKDKLLAQLNGVIRKPGMYKKSAWTGIELSEEVETLLAKPDQTPAEQARQNRLLLHAAYPDLITGL